MARGEVKEPEGRPNTIAGLVTELRRMVFVSARDWHRSIRINREERDYIARALDSHEEVVIALALIQGFNWQLDESDHGKEIKRRALAALSKAKGDA